MKTQLVIQFVISEDDDFDSFIEIEEEIIKLIEPKHEVDGHDFGAKEFNMFINTNAPKEASSQALKAIPSRYKESMKIAYRPTEGEAYKMIYPIEYIREVEVR